MSANLIEGGVADVASKRIGSGLVKAVRATAAACQSAFAWRSPQKVLQHSNIRAL